ncbi:MAG: hypothetical protein IKT58_06625 [Oscillospiraceae bacterium]|nr:hypothetical protein [Oscillospiraceae bacterium]
MKRMKQTLSMLLVFAMLLGFLPGKASAKEGDYVYLSVSFDGKYIDDQYGQPIVYYPVALDSVAAVDLEAYGLEDLRFDADGDGNYDTTALQLLIYAHEELYGGSWADVDFDPSPGSSYFKDGIFGFTENLVYFLNGDFPVDESQQSDFMTVGATSDRIVLEAGDFLDVASFGCYSFLWDMLGGFHIFADEEDNYVHDYTVLKGQPLTVKLKHSFCDLMYGEAWVYDAGEYEIFYGKTFGEAEGSVFTDGSGTAEIVFPQDGTYYLWCDGGLGSDDGTHGACDHYSEFMEPCVVSSPAYAKVSVKGEETPVVDQNLKLSHSLNLASDISVNLLVYKAYLEGFDMDTVYVESTLEVGAANGGTETKVIRIEPVLNGYFYYFTLNGLTAVQMNDRITSVLYGTKDGRQYASPVDEYSIGAYAYSQLNKDIASDSLKTLCADLLRYGAGAQIYKKYRVDQLADGAMTELHRSFLSDMEGVTFGNNYKLLSDLGNAPISWAGKTLDLGSKVMIKYVFDISAYKGAPEELSLHLRFKDVSGKETERIITVAESYNGSDRLYAFSFDGLLAAELRSVVYAQIFVGETPVSTTMQYSADTYGNNKTGELGDLCKALFAYSDSALAYFVGL